MKILEKQISSLDNAQQLAAIQSTDKNILIVAGAGTGKTHTIVQKIKYMVHNELIYPSSILATTFTNKAAHELRERIESNANIESKLMHIGTFHSICLEIIQKYQQFTSFNSETQIVSDQLSVMRKIVERHRSSINPIKIVDKIQKHKEGMLSCMTQPEMTIFNYYQKELKDTNSIDFSDMIYMVLELWDKYPDILQISQSEFKTIFVDEFQDINKLQYKWLSKIITEDSYLCCVGDPDQAIYSFRGGNPDYIVRFEHYFKNSKIYKLEQNYRSGRPIIDCANSLIVNNKNRLKKTLISTKDEAEVRIFKSTSPSVEAENIAQLVQNHKGSIAILVRNKAQIPFIEEGLAAENIAYSLSGSRSISERVEIKDMIAYLKLCINHNDVDAFTRAIKSPKRGIGDVTIAKIINYRDENGTDLLSACEQIAELYSDKVKNILLQFFNLMKSANEFKTPVYCVNYIMQNTDYSESLNSTRIESLNKWVISLSKYDSIKQYFANTVTDKVQIITIHASKGLEFDNVFIPGCEEGTLPSIASNTSDDIEEERRLFYVAITRARHSLYISYCQHRPINGIMKPVTPSRFVHELRLKSQPQKRIYFFKGEQVRHVRFGIGSVIECGQNCAKVDFFGIQRIVSIDEIVKWI